MIMKVYERFVLEPRAKYHCGGGCNGVWLVARDTKDDSYVLEEGSNKRYARFNNSKEAYEWLNKHYKQG